MIIHEEEITKKNIENGLAQAVICNSGNANTCNANGIEIAEETITTELEEDTVECIDEGDQSLAEYKPQIGGQPNPFENDTPTEIDDRPVEDYIGEGEDRPGEGLHY